MGENTEVQSTDLRNQDVDFASAFIQNQDHYIHIIGNYSFRINRETYKEIYKIIGNALKEGGDLDESQGN